jgi:hypothetical protein
LVITSGEGDGFIQDALSGLRIQAEFGFAFGMSLLQGAYFRGSGTFEIEITTHITLGPIEIQGLRLTLIPELERPVPQFRLDIGAHIKLELGPFVAVVQNIGLRNLLQLDKGNLGPANLGMEFKPPTGIGLSLDTPVVRGGGFLLFDTDREEYGGALELSIKDMFTVTAVGIVTTKFPDGSKGFSLLLIIGVTFQPGIPIGFGFFISGLGGMIGIHRTINTDALREGVKNNSIDNILFPENVVANITRIISDIRTIFPPKRDQFMIGFMARITWGVPALIKIDFGLCVEFADPFRIAILGVIKIALPTEDAAILQLQVNFVGIIDFEKGMLSFDASLYNSRILFITLEGDMALRVSWGSEPGFLLSVGGFHPAFKPPAHLGIGGMKRITLSIFADNPRLVFTTYFALTSNTVQFGAKLELFFEIAGFTVEGFLAFDVLFQFSPFYFIAQIEAMLAVKMGGSTLLSLHLKLSLEGPTPWIAKGEASFSILFFEISVDFEVTWGEKRSDALPLILVLPKVLEALNQDKNWLALLPDNRFQLVTMRELNPAETQLVLQPLGTLQIGQKIVPMGLELTKFGHNKPQDIRNIQIESLSIEQQRNDTDETKEQFAPSSYREMGDEDKLSAASYVRERNGVQLRGGDQLYAEYAIGRPVAYERIVSDFDPDAPKPFELYIPIHLDFYNKFPADYFTKMAQNGAVGKSELALANQLKSVKHENAVSLKAPEFVIAHADTLTAAAGLTFAGGSRAEAEMALGRMSGADLSSFVVMPAYMVGNSF